MYIALIIFVFVLLITCGFTIFYFTWYPAISLLGLEIAFFTMIATVGVAIVIYRAQEKKYEKDSKNKIKTALAIMYAELDMALDKFALNPLKDLYQGRNIRSAFNTNINELKASLTEKQFRHLVSVVNYIDYLVEKNINHNAREGMKLLVREWMVDAMCSEYNCYYPLLDDYKQVLNKNTFELMAALQETEVTYDAELYEVCGSEVPVKYKYDKHKKTIQIYNEERLMIDGTLGLLWNSTGFGDGYRWSQDYDGFYKCGKRDGKGTAYSKDTRKIIAEGTWKDGYLADGVEYDWVIHIISGIGIVKIKSDDEQLITNDENYRKKFQLNNDEEDEERIRSEIECCNNGTLYIIDIVKRDGNIFFKNFRLAKEFIET